MWVLAFVFRHRAAERRGEAEYANTTEINKGVLESSMKFTS